MSNRLEFTTNVFFDMALDLLLEFILKLNGEVIDHIVTSLTDNGFAFLGRISSKLVADIAKRSDKVLFLLEELCLQTL